ncbi:PilW family protein [Pelagicoccus mobilis]|uniref:Prepilin-type N-terminal cleavage/methylation domain-containing protein n=1 Tax=Pelagicoccus mobilis TaxID=415221 RepID=A0A934RY92_9BACT|nr:prepilin-type N-terminal cleavage/methylation domain-containing protein [Pelagicoccus mobilis]MBK1879940.1 prepilin-type N-terminal cleavage/methylation domain-containing protein [Pelagicoccus mobilis]
MRASNSKKGMTLVELLITMSLCGLVLAASTGSLLFLAKSTRGLGNYQEMNMASRFALEDFGSDARMTSDVNSASDSRVSIEVYNSSGSTDTIVYSYDADAGTFSRTEGGVTRVLLEDVITLSLNYFNLSGVALDSSPNPLEVKEIQLQAEMYREVMQIGNTNEIISARFMMRNRRVSS